MPPSIQPLAQVVCRASDQRIVTETDHVRVFNLLQRESRRGVGHNTVVDLIDSARLVSSQNVPPDVVTMLSRVAVMVTVAFGDHRPAHEDRTPLTRQEWTLCYPEQANPTTGYVSVLTPVGAALLGRRVGDLACWNTPQGEHGEATIVAVLFQPEAHGDYVA